MITSMPFGKHTRILFSEAEEFPSSTSQKDTSFSSRSMRNHLASVLELRFHSRQNAACVKPDVLNSSINSRRSSSVYEARPGVLLSFVSMPNKLSGFAGADYGVEEEAYTEELQSKTDAIARELQIKKWSKAKKKFLIKGDVEKLKVLSKRHKF